MEDLNKLSKKELEEIGREYGIELDRRKSRKSLVEELSEFIDDTIIEEETQELREVIADTIIEEETQELREVVQPEIKPESFRSLREAKKYAKKHGGRVVEKGRFYVL
jgi:predicted hydrocarbon binding protein